MQSQVGQLEDRLEDDSGRTLGQGRLDFVDHGLPHAPVALYLVQAQRQDFGEGTQHLQIAVAQAGIGLEAETAQGAIDVAVHLDGHAHVRADGNRRGRWYPLRRRYPRGVRDQLGQIAIDHLLAVAFGQGNDLALVDWAIHGAIHLFQHAILLAEACEKGYVHPQILAYHP